MVHWCERRSPRLLTATGAAASRDWYRLAQFASSKELATALRAADPATLTAELQAADPRDKETPLLAAVRRGRVRCFARRLPPPTSPPPSPWRPRPRGAALLSQAHDTNSRRYPQREFVS